MDIRHIVENFDLLLRVDSYLADQYHRTVGKSFGCLLDQLVVYPVREQAMETNYRPRQILNIPRYLQLWVEGGTKMAPVGTMSDYLRVWIKVFLGIVQSLGGHDD